MVLSIAVLSFQGNRLSTVYFTRSKYLYLKDEYKQIMREHGFPIPGREWEEHAGLKKASQKAAVPVETAVPVAQRLRRAVLASERLGQGLPRSARRPTVWRWLCWQTYWPDDKLHWYVHSECTSTPGT